MKALQERYKTSEVYPSFENIFRALELTKFEDVRVVILGQDPYHTPGAANGLAFSVGDDFKGKLPPSLYNILAEVEENLGCDIRFHGDLTKWAKQGVLLLNTILTVEKGNPLSHEDLGWELFTNKIIRKLSRKGGVVFMLWGAKAQEKRKHILWRENLVLKSSHPSPLSARGFFGNKHFYKANRWLAKKGLGEIDWSL